MILVTTARASEERTPSLDAVAWLAGCWGEVDEHGEPTTEEYWTAPRGGIMLGIHRDTSPQGAFFEYLRIETDAEGKLVYQASPMGGPTTAFPLAGLDKHIVRFENSEHDWPQRIVYELAEAGDTLHVRAEGLTEGSRKLAWSWLRLPCFE